MKLDTLELEIIKYFFSTRDIKISDERIFINSINIQDREYSGVGFITEFHKNEALLVDNQMKSYKWGEFGIMLNDKVDVGCLLYIYKGCINSIECYTYSEPWPDNITSIKFYSLNEGGR